MKGEEEPLLTKTGICAYGKTKRILTNSSCFCPFSYIVFFSFLVSPPPFPSLLSSSLLFSSRLFSLRIVFSIIFSSLLLASSFLFSSLFFSSLLSSSLSSSLLFSTSLWCRRRSRSRFLRRHRQRLTFLHRVGELRQLLLFDRDRSHRLVAVVVLRSGHRRPRRHRLAARRQRRLVARRLRRR